LEVQALQGAGCTDGCPTDLKKFKNIRKITLLSTGTTTKGQHFLKNLVSSGFHAPCSGSIE